MRSDAGPRHAIFAALPLAAACTAVIADLAPLSFAYRPNELGIVSPTTLRSYPVQQEVFWYATCVLMTGALTWAFARAWRAVDTAPRLGMALESCGAAALASLLWLPDGFGTAAVGLALVSAFAVARFASSQQAKPHHRAPRETEREVSSRFRTSSLLWWIAYVAMASVYSSHTVNPDGLWGGLANVYHQVPDVSFAQDHWYFHGEWGEHLAWADQIRNGDFQGRDFFCLYGPLYEQSLVALWAVAGRSIAAFTLWHGLSHFGGLLCLFALGHALVRHRLVLLAIPFLVPFVSLRIGLPFLALGLLLQWRSRQDPRWCAGAGAVAGGALLFSQEFGLAVGLVGAAGLAFSGERRAGIAFGAGLLAIVAPVLGVFAWNGALGPMLNDLVQYPSYVAAGYANLAMTPLLDRVPLSLAATAATWQLELRLAYSLPALCVAAVLLPLPMERLTPFDWKNTWQALRKSIFSDSGTFGIVALGLFGLLSFRVALGRSDLGHLLDAAPPAALIFCVAGDRVLSAWRSNPSLRLLATWRAALIGLFALQSGLLAATTPGDGLGRSYAGLRHLVTGNRSAESPTAERDARVPWLADWLEENTTPNDRIFVLPNGASYYYLAERRNSTRFVLSAMIVTNAHRREVLVDLIETPPRWIIWDQAGARIDGLSDRLTLGKPTLDWITDNYVVAKRSRGFAIMGPRNPDESAAPPDRCRRIRLSSRLTRRLAPQCNDSRSSARCSARQRPATSPTPAPHGHTERHAMSWNFGDLLDGVDEVLPPESPALIHGEQIVEWGDFARRTNNLARELIASGGAPGDKVAIYVRNCTEYTETLAACFKARLVHVNVNFRYLDDELEYIIENSDAKFVVFGQEFTERVERIQQKLANIDWIQVGDTPAPFARGYEEFAEAGRGEPLAITRSGDDLLFIYTGGTTGMPKAVMWRQEDLWGALGYGQNVAANASSRPENPATHIANIKKHGPGPKQLVACPLMHGTGLLTTIGHIAGGGCVVTLSAPHFDVEELWKTVERVAADSLIIVGDAFARPMLNSLDENPGKWDISSLKVIISSGVMWSREVKQGLLEHHKSMILADMFGSSEAIGFGTSMMTYGHETKTAKFAIGDRCKVFTEDHREVVPGSGERGYIARCGPIPVGYYKDEEKTAKTFPVIDGNRYSVPGDWCTVEADGTLNLLGRGSACINTAGEKVYPEEIEESLKTHDGVEDALVFGIPDEKWGQAVTAVVTTRSDWNFDEAALRTHVRDGLAGYKTPKRIHRVTEMFRAANGKADYKAAAAHVASLPNAR